MAGPERMLRRRKGAIMEYCPLCHQPAHQLNEQARPCTIWGCQIKTVNAHGLCHYHFEQAIIHRNIAKIVGRMP